MSLRNLNARLLCSVSTVIKAQHIAPRVSSISFNRQLVRQFAVRRRPPSKKAPVPVELCWKEVVDEPSGQSYWWNTVTDETVILSYPYFVNIQLCRCVGNNL